MNELSIYNSTFKKQTTEIYHEVNFYSLRECLPMNRSVNGVI